MPMPDSAIITLAEAERERVMNEARNALSPEARAFETGLKRLGIIPDALRESMRAVEKIDSIRIFDAGGMMGGGNGAGGVSANFGDSLSGHLLRYQYNSPILGAILNEAGFAEGKGSLDTLVGGLRNGTAVEPAANGHAAAAE